MPGLDELARRGAADGAGADDQVGGHGGLLVRFVVDADAFGRLAGTGPTATPGAIVDLEHLRSTFFAGVPVRSVAAGVMAWTQLFGTVNAELFGHLHNVIDDGDAWFETVLAALVESVGVLPAPR